MYYIFISKNNQYIYIKYREGPGHSLSFEQITIESKNGLICHTEQVFTVYKHDDITSDFEDLLCFGFYIVPVIIPKDANTYYDDDYREENIRIILSDKIIIGHHRYKLYDPKTIKFLNLKITPNYVASAIHNGEVYILNWLKNNNLLLVEYLNGGVGTLCDYGRCNIFELASDSNQVNVLEWCKNSNIPLDYSEKTLDRASIQNYTEVIAWWFNSGLPLRYSTKSLDGPSRNNHPDVLQLWFSSGLPLKYSTNALEWASEKGHVNILQLWFNSGLPLKYSTNALEWASEKGHVNILQLWFNSGLPLKYSNNLLDYIRMNTENIQDVIDCWMNSGISLPYKMVIYCYSKMIIKKCKQLLLLN
jgi:hypothetical protein